MPRPWREADSNPTLKSAKAKNEFIGQWARALVKFKFAMEEDLIAAAAAAGQSLNHPQLDPDLLAAAEAIAQPINGQSSAVEMADAPNPSKPAIAPRTTRPPISDGMNQLAGYASSSDDESSSDEPVDAPADAPDLESARQILRIFLQT
jgi:hypothetical protein